MNGLHLLLVVVFAPFVIVGVWFLVYAVVDLFRPVDVGWCACGKRIVRDGPRPDYSDLTVHAQGLCQPFREWVDD